MKSGVAARWTLPFWIGLGEAIVAAEVGQEENVGGVSDELGEILPFDAVDDGIEVVDLSLERVLLA